MTKKQPKLILRESCIHDMVREWPAGTFIEMGAGTGHMTRLFLDLGYRGVASDLGPESRETMRRTLQSMGEAIQVFDDPVELGDQRFDYLFAFEVLEHIEDDLAALREWTTHLRAGGRLLVSVPAHERKYGRSDELVGHVRRYERVQLKRLLRNAGFESIRIVNYGFPVTELTRRVSNWLVRNDRSYEELTMAQRSIASARKKPKIIDAALTVIGGQLFIPFRVVQRWFYRLDWGDGYVVTATKAGGETG